MSVIKIGGSGRTKCVGAVSGGWWVVTVQNVWEL